MKKLLIVVDFQNDFVTGSLGFDEAPQLENHIVHLIQTFQQNHDDIKQIIYRLMKDCIFLLPIV